MQPEEAPEHHTDSDTDSDTGVDTGAPTCGVVVVSYEGTIVGVTGKAPFGVASGDAIGLPVSGEIYYDTCVTDSNPGAASLFDHASAGDAWFAFIPDTTGDTGLPGYSVGILGSGMPQVKVSADRTRFSFADGGTIGGVDRWMSSFGTPDSDIAVSFSIEGTSAAFPDDDLPATFPLVSTDPSDFTGTYVVTFNLLDGPYGFDIQLTSLVH